jgi:hypothetical protein
VGEFGNTAFGEHGFLAEGRAKRALLGFNPSSKGVRRAMPSVLPGVTVAG